MPYENISIGIDGFMTLKHSDDEYPKIGFITMLLIHGDTRFQVEIGNNEMRKSYYLLIEVNHRLLTSVKTAKHSNRIL
ncbi:unnamed protein product [Schistosoma mattheei]|uniref:Uncharacterized protein n=1 Tax=Schistosoma mattheei TaxID=31246 RepID=A0AA85AXG4_9TREM|nr:unnamed protein product [Schistosoma mattheei]